jgi:DNA-binding beta-propeller fold protein YncE
MGPVRAALALGILGACSCAHRGWYPHEGPLLPHTVDLHFGVASDTMPAGWSLGAVSAVAVDRSGEVYVLQRGTKADPVLVFDAKGIFLRSWGRGLFREPHGLRLDPEGNLWATDSEIHHVLKFSRDGRLLLTLGLRGEPGGGAARFDGPTDVAFAPTGEVYVADGYGNSRIAKFSREGKFLAEWGQPGSAPGEFDIPHSIAVDRKGRVHVSDRENNRIQVFDGEGRFLREWTHLGATQCLFITPDDEMWIITHRNNVEVQAYETLAGRIMKVDLETGSILGSLESPGHWIAVGRSGEIFIASTTGNVLRWHLPD